jgi:hypothetical protein
LVLVVGVGAWARVRVLALDEGELCVFPSFDRPAAGGRRPVKHGMRRVTRGERLALGVVFHLAR